MIMIVENSSYIRISICPNHLGADVCYQSFNDIPKFKSYKEAKTKGWKLTKHPRSEYFGVGKFWFCPDCVKDYNL